MKKPVVLSGEERNVLRQLNNEQLRLLVQLKDRAEFQAIIDLVNLMIDIDKNYFFRENEGAMEPVQLALKHAYRRGASARGIEITRMIQGASSEILQREEATRKMKEKLAGGK